jgi:hypothetical protein
MERKIRLGIICLLLLMIGTVVASSREVFAGGPEIQPVCVKCNIFVQGCKSTCPVCVNPGNNSTCVPLN